MLYLEIKKDQINHTISKSIKPKTEFQNWSKFYSIIPSLNSSIARALLSISGSSFSRFLSSSASSSSCSLAAFSGFKAISCRDRLEQREHIPFVTVIKRWTPSDFFMMIRIIWCHYKMKEIYSDRAFWDANKGMAFTDLCKTAEDNLALYAWYINLALIFFNISDTISEQNRHMTLAVFNSVMNYCPAWYNAAITLLTWTSESRKATSAWLAGGVYSRLECCQSISKVMTKIDNTVTFRKFTAAL